MLVLILVLLFGRSIRHGPMLDDYPIALRIQRWFAGDPDQTWWNLFEFGRFDEGLRFSGVLPWWTAEDLFVRFLRPVAAATHVVDQRLWPSSPELMHVHSLVWAAALGLATLWLYRQALSPRLAALAAITYSVSAIHMWPVMWISNRNALVSATFGVLAFGLYRLGRISDSRRSWLAPPAFALCLLSAEAGVSTLAFVAAFELTEGRTSRHRRVFLLGSMLVVVAAWRVFYDTAGFGATSSGAYLDPFRAPAAFLAQAPPRLGWLLMELWTPFEFVRWRGFPSAVQWVLAVLFCSGSFLAMVRGWRDRTLRTFLLGGALALPPLLTSMPQARLLTFVWMGLAPCVAATVRHYLRMSGARRGLAGLVGLGPLIVSPAIVAGGFEWLESQRQQVVDSPGLHLAPDKRVRGRSLILVHAPSFDRAMALGFARAQAGKALPSFTWLLSTGEAEPLIRRRGCCTIVVEQQEGFIGDPLASYYRGPQVPFAVGDRVKTLGFRAEVEAVDRGGAATRVAFEFPHQLGVEQLLYATWSKGDFRRLLTRTLPQE